MLIGVCGRARAGKNTVAEMFKKIHPRTKLMALADPLKAAVQEWFDFTDDQVFGDSKEIVDERYGLTPRRLLQHVGTEGARALYPDVWVDNLLRRAGDVLAEVRVRNIMHGRHSLEIYDHVVVTDVRFHNEAKKIQEAGGEIWHVWSPFVSQAAAAHASEQECDAIREYADVSILNQDSLGWLEAQVRLHAKGF